MSRHDDTVTLRQMLDHINEAVALVHDRRRSDLDILWAIVTVDFPPLGRQIMGLLPKH